MTSTGYAEISLLSSGMLPRCAIHWNGNFNEYYALQLSMGSIDLWYDDRCHTLDGAWFWWGYPGPEVRFHPAAGHASWTHRYITFQGPLVTRWAAEGLLFEAPQSAANAEECADKFDGLLALAARADTWGSRRAVNVLEQILLELADARSQPSAAPAWLPSVLEELSSGVFAPDYAGLAGRHGMSLTSLRERFRQTAGVTLHGYVLQTRLARARSLLTETDLPLKTIADQLGYSDVYYFSRQFHAVVGVSPSAYRRSRQR